MIYITGDKHGNFNDIIDFCNSNCNLTSNDFLIITGDCGINYFLDKRDNKLKKKLSELPITLICIHGNHEERPELIKSYKLKTFCSKNELYTRVGLNITKIKRADDFVISDNIFGKFYVEQEYPNILFPAIGKTFKLNNQLFYHLGGAYSIDKYYRLKLNASGVKGFKWFSSEQLTSKEKKSILTDISLLTFFNTNKDIIILSHTCPKKFIPEGKNIDTDLSMENFLDKVEESLDYKKWYCGHFHIDKVFEKIHFLYNDIIMLDDKMEEKNYE